MAHRMGKRDLRGSGLATVCAYLERSVGGSGCGEISFKEQKDGPGM